MYSTWELLEPFAFAGCTAALLVSANTSCDLRKWALAASYVFNPLTLVAVLVASPALLSNALLACLYASCSRRNLLAVPITLLGLWYVAPLQAACVAAACVLYLWQPVRSAATAATAAADSSSGSASLFTLVAQAAAAVLLCATAYATAPPLSSLLAPMTVDASSGGVELGLSWYLWTSAFLRHLPYFSLLLWLHPLLYVLPITLRYAHAPGVAFVLLCGVAAILDPSAGYTTLRLPLLLALALAAGYPTVTSSMRNVTLWAGFTGFALAVGPGMKYLWVVLGSGNANFSFNMQLALALSAGSLLAEYAAAAERVRAAADGELAPPPAVAAAESAKQKRE